MSGNKVSREIVAVNEIGSTEISRTMSVLLSVFFLLAIFTVPLVQYAVDRTTGTRTTLSTAAPTAAKGGETLFASVNRHNRAVLKKMHDVEISLEDGSLLRQVFLPPLQYIFLKFLEQGNEKVLPGREDWLFFAPGVEYLLGRPFLDDGQLRTRRQAHEIWERPLNADPRRAIIDFNRQLAARDIELVIVPTPVKAAIQPERLAGGRLHGPLTNRSFAPFLQELKADGVHVYDPRPILAGYAQHHGDAFLATDTHWLPGAMQVVAEGLGAYIKKNFPLLTGTLDFYLQPQKVMAEGDLSRMVTLPEDTALFPPQEVVVEQVMTNDNSFWQPDHGAQILLLGDSFTNIYSFSGLGWGFGAGFAEHLSYLLRQPLDLLARNDSGAYVTREMLAAELGRGRDRLAGKKLVIWQFAERELAFGDWRPIDMVVREKKAGEYFVAGPGEKVLVTGVVEAISRSPRPGSVPYRDNIVTIHLVDLKTGGQPSVADRALVYGWGMRDNSLSSLAAVRPGDSLSLQLSSWEEVEQKYGGYRRTPLEDEMLELELPNWGTVIDEEKK